MFFTGFLRFDASVEENEGEKQHFSSPFNILLPLKLNNLYFFSFDPKPQISHIPSVGVPHVISLCFVNVMDVLFSTRSVFIQPQCILT